MVTYMYKCARRYTEKIAGLVFLRRIEHVVVLGSVREGPAASVYPMNDPTTLFQERFESVLDDDRIAMLSVKL
jgi:hypothetical protein